MGHSKKPVILVVISTYLPGERAGGPVRTTSNMVGWLGDDFDFKILTSDRDSGDTSAYPDIVHQQWQRVGKSDVRYLAPQEQSLWQLRDLFQSTPYDILYINAVFATLSLKVLLLHRLGLLPQKPIIVAPRGQWRPEALGLKAQKKHIFMAAAKLMRLYHNLAWQASNNDEKHDIEREIGVANIRQIRVIGNLPIPLTATSRSVTSQIKCVGEAKLVFLARMVHNKGLDILLRHLFSVKGNVFLDVYGSLEDPMYWEKCEALINQLPNHIRVTYCGVAPFDQVLDVLSQYHLFVLPTLSENFGQVIVEALAAGCPVLISDRTPWQQLSSAGAGWVLPLEEAGAWQAAIQEMINMDEESFDTMASRALHYGTTFRTQSQPADELREFLAGLTEGRQENSPLVSSMRCNYD